MKLARLASELRRNILYFIMDTLEHGTRNSTILFQCSGTEETENHLTVTKLASNISLCEGQPKKAQNNGFRVQVYCFLSSLLIVCLLLANVMRSRKRNGRRKPTGRRCEQKSREGLVYNW